MQERPKLVRRALILSLFILILLSSIHTEQVKGKNPLWETAISVQKACLWLLENQNADGSWGFGSLEQSRLTPLIANALLSCGISPEDERISKALSWISRNRLSIQELASLGFAIDSFLRAGKEGYTLNSLLRDLISSQKEDGSWEESIILTSIAILAIKSSQTQEVAESIDKACNYLFSIRINGTWPWNLGGDYEKWIEPASYLIVALASSGRYNESVHEALKWLKSVVNQKESWDLNLKTASILAWALATEDPASQEVTKVLSWIRDGQSEAGYWISIEDTGFITFFLHRISGSVPISSLKPLVSIGVNPRPILVVKGVYSIANITLNIAGGILINPRIEIGSSQLLTISLISSDVNDIRTDLNDIDALYPGDSVEISLKITTISDKEASISIPISLRGSDFFGSFTSWSSEIIVRVTEKGMPIINIAIIPEKGEIVEGEYMPLYLRIENVGTAPAFSLNCSLQFYPLIIEIKSGDMNIYIDKLDPGDKVSSALVLKALEPKDESELLSIEAKIEYIGGTAKGKAGILVRRISFWEKYSNDILGAVLGAILGFIFTAPVLNYLLAIKNFLKKLWKMLTKFS